MKFLRNTVLLSFFLSLISIPVYAKDKAGTTLAVAKFVRGKVYYVRNGKKKRVRVRTIFNKDDKLFTQKGKVDIQIGRRAVLRVSNYTVLYFRNLYEMGDVEQVLVELGQGRVYSKIAKKYSKGGGFKVKTPTAVAGVRGTEFVVSENSGDAADDKKTDEAKIESGVYVNDGSVSVSSTTREEEVAVEGGNQVVTTGSELKQQILDSFVKRKMQIFKKLKLLKEKNYKMLKKQQERNQAALERIRKQQEKMREKFEH